ncbi:ABC transporter substrate-binding protein [Tumebacillus permanentifrigoris]|uniref:Iron complex transport system substrate-binding protein n=1 Tax=Tumebacillus permanentifrigoris TaxID=378543 RepID=A0A316DH77_9BACL|nr:cobalamin-binding protein [Tumebacillus permanentifrigoris]PWK15933.1 iron complex transport system substrate-binding protein [Tumebacillus permanentifrigoris]
MEQRIVSICPSNTELLELLGLMDRVVGVDDYSDWPVEKVRDLPKLGPDLNIDMDKLVALQPDLVIASLSVPGMEKNIDRLQALGLNYLVLNPKTFEEIYLDIATLGQACGVEDRAQEVIASLRGRVTRITEALQIRTRQPDDQNPESHVEDPSNLASQASSASIAAASTSVPKLYWEWWPRPLISPGSVNWLTELSRLAGAENLFADKPGDSYTAEHSEVIERAPDYVFAVWCGVHADKVKPSMITDRPGWDVVPAVQQGRVLVLEEGLYCRPSQRLFDGLEELARIIHPDLNL